MRCSRRRVNAPSPPKTRVYVKLINGVHRTSILLNAKRDKNGKLSLSKGQMSKARKALCPNKGCRCAADRAHQQGTRSYVVGPTGALRATRPEELPVMIFSERYYHVDNTPYFSTKHVRGACSVAECLDCGYVVYGGPLAVPKFFDEKDEAIKYAAIAAANEMEALQLQEVKELSEQGAIWE